MTLKQSSKEQNGELWIVIPAYNAEDTLPSVIQGLNNQGFHNIIVVDDGSKDSTFTVATTLPVHALKHFANRGQGAALQTGITYALTQHPQPTAIITFDADGQHRPEDITALATPVLEGKADIALGSRFLSHSNVPLIRRITLKTGAFLIYLFHGLWLTDSHNGLRCLSLHASRELDITSDRMEHASEIIEIMKTKKWTYTEIPIIVHYSTNTLQRGHGGLREAFRVLARMIWRKFIK